MRLVNYSAPFLFLCIGSSRGTNIFLFVKRLPIISLIFRSNYDIVYKV